MEIRDIREKDFFWLDNEYLNGYAKLLNPNATVVYLSLCRHANNSTQKCFPSMRLIAEENNISTKTVERAIKMLEEWNIIAVTRQKGENGKQMNNVYTLLSKSVWGEKPTDSQSTGTADRQIDCLPTDSNDVYRQTDVLHNYTNITKLSITRDVAVAPALFPKEIIISKVDVITQKTGLPQEKVRNELLKFIAYWTEKSINGSKERWQKEKVFDPSRRLATWFGNIKEREGLSASKYSSKEVF